MQSRICNNQNVFLYFSTLQKHKTVFFEHTHYKHATGGVVQVITVRFQPAGHGPLIDHDAFSSGPQSLA